MKKIFPIILSALLFLSFSTDIFARGSGRKSSGIYHNRSHTGRSRSTIIHRSLSAKKQFMKQTGYPHGRPGYVVDHIVPLNRGGADAPSNMEWLTKEAAKAKDKWK
jgi:hypothetical protein